MHGILNEAAALLDRGKAVAVATVVQTWSSAPRDAGASMLVSADGAVLGSVSGGCVDGDVYELAREVLVSGVPTVVRYGVSDDAALAVGLTCGGTIEVLVRRHIAGAATGAPPGSRGPDDVALARGLAAAVGAHRPAGLATVVEHPDPARVGAQLLVVPTAQGGDASGTLGGGRLDAAVAADAAGLIGAGRTEVLTYGADGERQGTGCRVLVEVFAAPARLIVAGVTDFAAAVTTVGRFLGHRVTVCDARPVFATRERFPDAHDVVVDWPHRYLAAEVAAGRTDRRTALLVLTHDARFDVPLLEVALRSPALGFIGAMGSRRTHEDRCRRLREAGLTGTELARLASPVGLDLGARTPEETAISIAAEMVARRWGGGGGPLGELDGPIHHPPPAF
ncbi:MULTISPECIES: XdhC family protein [unclassified Actinotalea]|uniref:XdhC family protein n=1 Tax=unclassified Actinotalea TaxID=2638618 RepID=UPI0015F5B30A|nr:MULTISPECIES: XdhC family protein [unclassified Actinotalea]